MVIFAQGILPLGILAPGILPMAILAPGIHLVLEQALVRGSRREFLMEAGGRHKRG